MKRKKSLFFRLLIIMLLLVAGTVVLCLFLNNTFLERYYIYNKQKELLDGFQEIEEAGGSETLETEAFEILFERICSNGNIDIVIFGDEQIIASSSNNSGFWQELINDMFYSLQQKEGKLVAAAENYMLERQTDSRLQSEYLVLWGRLDGGRYVYMRTALESIRESAAITNRFFAAVGVLAVLVSIVVIIFLSKSISHPIQELCVVSDRMADLDFDAKYHSKKHSSREIEQLGSHMNELSETLEKTISELKAANNELQKDIQKKEQIDEMRREFLSNVSHELKTPLALIQGYAEGLKEFVDDDAESREFYCDVIVDEADKMNRMVKMLLTLNQLESGSETVEMSRFDMFELIQGVKNASSILAEQNGIRMELDAEGPLYVWGDEFKAEEVITNYLSNAIHYAEGEKRIVISCRKRENLLRVSVFNTGNPIPEDELDRIWEKFYKVDKARTREYGGSGIGLSIVKAIMDSFHQACGVLNHADGVEFWMEMESCG